jgi:7-cyano-7-deazaguanine synthase
VRGVVVVSGGLDSLVLHDWLQAEGHDLITVRFHYGSRHDAAEARSAHELYPYLTTVDLMLPSGGSALMSKDVPLPEGRYDDPSMRSTVVPFRNGVMLAFAVAYAEAVGAQRVWYGAHAGDHAIYPDCRRGFVRALSRAARLGTYGKVVVEAPFARMTKAAIVRAGARLGRPCVLRMAKTWSCYAGGDRPCGVCGTCVERDEAFAEAGVVDGPLAHYV